jgi:tRNA A-37 threonylcarbamoyl transferase component Bud32
MARISVGALFLLFIAVLVIALLVGAHRRRQGGDPIWIPLPLFFLLGLVLAGLLGLGRTPVWFVLAVLALGSGLVWLFNHGARSRLQRGARCTNRRCATCGGRLPRYAPHGLCPRCLLQQGLSEPVPAPDFANFLGDASAKLFGGAAPPPVAERSYHGPFIPPTPADLAPHFPQLEILGLLGQGGMGAVYKARQTKLGRLVALKILPIEAGRDPAFAERFTREARALARLGHPNIVAVHDFGDTGELYYFIMEYVDGISLRQSMQSGRMPPEDALRIVPQICDALQYAHEEGIVHRDIKPENILIDKRGRLKIADFGLAKLLDRPAAPFTLTGSLQVMGTPHYMAPEQMERPSAVDHRADIYSLGVVFYEMLTGELPLGHFPLPSHKATVDTRLDEIVLHALAKDPEQRYQHASEVKSAVSALDGTAPVLPPQPTPMRTYQEEVDRELLRLQVLGPAGGLILTGILAAVQWSIVGIAVLDHAWHKRDFWTIASIEAVLFPVLVVAAGALMIAGRRMIRLESYSFVYLACCWAMVPWSAAWIIGFPFGLWALRVLDRRPIKLVFIGKIVQARLSSLGLPAPTGIVRRKMRSVLGTARSLFLGSRVQPKGAPLPGTPASDERSVNVEPGPIA